MARAWRTVSASNKNFIMILNGENLCYYTIKREHEIKGARGLLWVFFCRVLSFTGERRCDMQRLLILGESEVTLPCWKSRKSFASNS